MASEERLTRIETQIEKQNEGIRGLIVVGRTCLDSLQEMRKIHREDHRRLQAEMKVSEEKLNILIDTVDRIIRRDPKREK